jgi:precorrin-6y C5,15-methyltransferase (decarboxylating) CbiE subunit
MTDEAMSPLRRRMIEDMTIRKLAPKTQHDYVQRIKNFAAFLGRSPDTASFEDVRRYQLHLAASGVGVPTLNQTVSTLRFFFRVTLRRHEIVEHTHVIHEPRKLPVVLSVEEVARLRGRKRVCVLASGDPFHYGVGATLARRIPANEMLVVTAPSAFSIAAARMGWGLQDVTVLSLHGRPIDLVRRHLHPGRQILALTSDGNGPQQIADLLSGSGFGDSKLTVLEALGVSGLEPQPS